VISGALTTSYQQIVDINSIVKNTTVPYELIVVNNNSTDGTVEFIDKLNIENLIVIHNPINYGYAKGMNVGIVNANGKYTILLNNDTEVDKNWDHPLIDILYNNENVFAVTPLTNNCGNEARISIRHNSVDDFFSKVTDIWCTCD